jgi:hypothetical protein
MTVNELRIGNWVKPISPRYNEKYLQIESVSNGLVNIEFREYKINEVTAIPLTPEILEKCTLKKGFGTIVYSNGKETKEYHLSYPIVLVGNVINESYSVLYKYTRGCQNEEDFICEIEYLHQLQNLFYTLTNEELIINL